jgi:hypothetical protein
VFLGALRLSRQLQVSFLQCSTCTAEAHTDKAVPQSPTPPPPEHMRAKAKLSCPDVIRRAPWWRLRSVHTATLFIKRQQIKMASCRLVVRYQRFEHTSCLRKVQYSTVVMVAVRTCNTFVPVY